eukprot:Selendium_serpulae@DN1653_c0_g1_i1.p1
MVNPDTQEQFLMRYSAAVGDSEIPVTDVFHHDPRAKAPIAACDLGALDHEGKPLTVTGHHVAWSPQGSYLVSFHSKGIVLRGALERDGEVQDFEKLMKVAHEDCVGVQFSPDERFLLTWDGSQPDDPKHRQGYCVWRVATGQLLRIIPTPALSHDLTVVVPSTLGVQTFLEPHGRGGASGNASQEESQVNWKQVVCWSRDGKYLAMLGNKEVQLFEAPDTSKILKSLDPLRYNAAKMEWSPTENVLAMWIPELGDSPGRLVLLEISTRKEICSKNVFSVVHAEFIWQNEGKLLALLTRISRKVGKKAKKEVNQIEVFRVKEKNLPVDTVALEDVKAVKSIAWENGGSRLSVIVQEESTTRKHPTLRIYKVEHGTAADTNLIVSYPIAHTAAPLEFCTWSPLGTYFVLWSPGVESSLLFATVTSEGGKVKVEELQRDDHYMCNHISWDPSGRYVCSAVTMCLNNESAQFRMAEAAGYRLWTFQGRFQFERKLNKFTMFQWRPHPPSLLPPEQVEQIRKKLKDFSRTYDDMDRKIRQEHDDKRRALIQKSESAFMEQIDVVQEWRHNHELWAEYEAEWQKMEDAIEWESREETFEEEIFSKETVCPG